MENLDVPIKYNASILCKISVLLFKQYLKTGKTNVTKITIEYERNSTSKERSVTFHLSGSKNYTVIKRHVLVLSRAGVRQGISPHIKDPELVEFFNSVHAALPHRKLHRHYMTRESTYFVKINYDIFRRTKRMVISHA